MKPVSFQKESGMGYFVCFVEPGCLENCLIGDLCVCRDGLGLPAPVQMPLYRSTDPRAGGDDDMIVTGEA